MKIIFHAIHIFFIILFIFLKIPATCLASSSDGTTNKTTRALLAHIEALYGAYASLKKARFMCSPIIVGDVVSPLVWSVNKRFGGARIVKIESAGIPTTCCGMGSIVIQALNKLPSAHPRKEINMRINDSATRFFVDVQAPVPLYRRPS